MSSPQRTRAALAAAAVSAFLIAIASDGYVAAQIGQPTFTASSELVVLHATVTDKFHVYVAGLDAGAFAVFEDDQPQRIQFFNVVDTPVTVGLIVDDSASMYGMRTLVAAAAGAFAETSNPSDEMFAMTFSDGTHAVLAKEAPFTNNPTVLRAGLTSAMTMRGRTAMHDAVLEGLAYLKRGGYTRKVLVVLSDGDDNASVATFDRMCAAAESSNAVVYTIAVHDPLGGSGRPDRLKQLAAATGGQMFHPNTPAEIHAALVAVARDIRNTYTIGYTPTNAEGSGYRRVRVTARDPDGQQLSVRTRLGYVGQ